MDSTFLIGFTKISCFFFELNMNTYMIATVQSGLKITYTMGDQKVRGKVLFNRTAFIDCYEIS